MNKKIGIIGLSIVIIFTFLSFVSARPFITISDYSVDRGQLYAEDNYFVLRVTMENSGNNCASSVTVTVQPSRPFINDEFLSTEPIDICGSHETVELPLKLEPNTVGGTYPLTLSVSYSDPNETNVYSFTNTINIFIKGISEINAQIINSNPINIYPGDNAGISILVENDGSYTAESIKGRLVSNSGLDIKQSNSFFYIGTLMPKQSYIASLSVEIPKDNSSQAYNMILNLEYLENKNQKIKNIPLFLNVKSKALFKASESQSDKLYSNNYNKIARFKVTNIGSGLAKEIKVQMQPQFPFTTDGSIRYVNHLYPGESQTVEFVVNVDKAATVGNYAADLMFNFKDEQDNNMQDSISVPLYVQQKGIFQVIFLDYWYVWLIVIIIIVIILINRLRHK